MFKIIDGEYLKRWETGRKVQVSDSNVTKVYFTTKALDRAIEVDVVDGVAIVPKSLLQQSYDITVYVIADGKCKLNVLPVKDGERPKGYDIHKKEKLKFVDLDERVRELENLTGGNNDSGSDSGASSWNDLKDKPFWKEREKTLILEEFTVTTEFDSDYGVNMGIVPIRVSEGETYAIVFNGVEYECTSYEDAEMGYIIGSKDFSDYPFAAAPNVIITEKSGEYTVKQYICLEITKFGYLPYLYIQTKKTADRIPYITMEDVEKIKNAYNNGIPIRLRTNRASLGVYMQVDSVTDSFIDASCCMSQGINGLIESIQYSFSVSDGSLYHSGYSVSGTIVENGDSVPVMYCNNSAYKINIDSSGNLTATKLTS